MSWPCTCLSLLHNSPNIEHFCAIIFQYISSFSANKQKSKRKLRSRPDSDITTKDRLTTLECQDDKDETSSTTTESSTGDGDEKVRPMLFLGQIRKYL